MGWSYDYAERDRPKEWGWHEKALLRPTVFVQLAGTQVSSSTFMALVDSGRDHVLSYLIQR